MKMFVENTISGLNLTLTHISPVMVGLPCKSLLHLFIQHARVLLPSRQPLFLHSLYYRRKSVACMCHPAPTSAGCCSSNQSSHTSHTAPPHPPLATGVAASKQIQTRRSSGSQLNKESGFLLFWLLASQLASKTTDILQIFHHRLKTHAPSNRNYSSYCF